ncbi:hypothetical protein OSB04_010983 [Centaurea solstitialis]|uniref:Uncharacterized protein n=1 Tax=Centaurea solstitialis TaxID=347529 RepID=A0AA38WNN8_9ASTR|nr:hypothetical protein OSB04_010983 [Centaurea solstitialis]
MEDIGMVTKAWTVEFRTYVNYISSRISDTHLRIPRTLNPLKEIRSQTNLDDLAILASQLKWTRAHPLYNVIGDVNDGVKMRSASANYCLYKSFLSVIEPKNVSQALEDSDWLLAMQEELLQFKRNKVYRLVPRPQDKSIIQTKWIFRNVGCKIGLYPRSQVGAQSKDKGKVKVVKEVKACFICLLALYTADSDVNHRLWKDCMTYSHRVFEVNKENQQLSAEKSFLEMKLVDLEKIIQFEKGQESENSKLSKQITELQQIHFEC